MRPYTVAVLACVDVHYGDANATAACIAFASWTDGMALDERVLVSSEAAPEYQSGELYKRELPHVLAVLDLLAERPALVIVDGYVWLGADRPGLGAHLHDAIRVPVVGVAKTRFRSAEAIEVERAGTRPLFVTAVGIDAAVAADHVREMHGPFRIPTLLRRVDQLARRIVVPASTNAKW